MVRQRLFSTLNNDQCWLSNMNNNNNNNSGRDSKLPIQNTIQSNGPLLIYPCPFNKSSINENDINSRGDSIKDIISSLPSKITKSMNSIIDQQELFSLTSATTSSLSPPDKNNHLEVVVDKWILLSSSIFGKDNFTLNNDIMAKEMKDTLKLYPNKEIDKLHCDAVEDIERQWRRQRDRS